MLVLGRAVMALVLWRIPGLMVVGLGLPPNQGTG